MRIAFFSDLHLAPGRTNRCTASSRELLDLFDRVERDCDRVIVAGDLFDLDRPLRPGGWSEQLDAIRREWPDVVERLDAFEWIWGNHDPQLARFGVPEEREIVADGLRLLVLHGHQWDMALKKVPGLPQTANFIAGWMMRTGLVGVQNFFQEAPWIIDRAVNRVDPSRGAGWDRGIDGAARLIDEEGWDVVVAGHSHMLRLVSHQNGLYANTGALSEGTVDWLLVDTDEQRVETWRDGQLHDSVQRSERHRWQPAA